MCLSFSPSLFCYSKKSSSWIENSLLLSKLFSEMMELNQYNIMLHNIEIIKYNWYYHHINYVWFCFQETLHYSPYMSESVSREPTHNQHPLNECIWLIWGYTITIAILSGFVVSRIAYTNHTCTQWVSLMPEGLHYHSTWMSGNDSLRPTISPPLSMIVFPYISTVLYPCTQSVPRGPTGWPPLIMC